MIRALLQRHSDTPFGVFGYLTLFQDAAGVPHPIAKFVTGEEDWLDNKPQISSIPAGAYRCERTVFHKTGEPTFEVMHVPNRDRILIHSGNTEEDTMGCILLGTDYGALQVRDEDAAAGAPARYKWAIVNSRAAFAHFQQVLVGVDAFDLQIVWAEPGAWR